MNKKYDKINSRTVLFFKTDYRTLDNKFNVLKARQYLL